MKEYTYKLIDEVNINIQNIRTEEDIFFKINQAIDILENAFCILKKYITEYTFKNENEEILFFKSIKPELFSKLIYYRKVYNIEILRPRGSIDTLKKYFNEELEQIDNFYDRNIDLCKYYRAGCTHLDKYYFLREKPDINLSFDSFYFERDPIFSTCCDFKVAKILAYEHLAIYLNEESKKLDIPGYTNIGRISSPIKLTWTGKKTDLVELIYSLERAKSINNGNINIKELSKYIEDVFNIDLGDIYRTFLDLRDRKGENRTSFLNTLTKSLNDRMNELDNK